MEKTLLTGNEAIARGAYEANVSVATGYPGTPSTEILENVSKFYNGNVYCEWSPNEKVAFEAAVGATTTGARAITTMKLVGLNVAADPLMTLSYTGVIGGFVAIVADDPGMNSSQDEQDTRLFAHFAKVPVIEPADSQEAKDYLKAALELSEKFGTPVIFRTTVTISHSRSVVELADPIDLQRPHHFEKNPQRLVPIPAFARAMRVRLEERVEALSEEASVSPLNRVELNPSGDRRLGIVTSGAAYQYVKEAFPDANILKIGFAYPFPDKLFQQFNEQVDCLVVVEELEDFMEQHLRAIGIKTIGKKLGDEKLVPKFGALDVDVLRRVRRQLSESPITSKFVDACPAQAEHVASVDKTTLPVLPGRPPVLCPGCPHRGVFYALSKFNVVVSGDIGCYSLGVAPPLNCMDTILCMGGGFTVAHGINCAKNDRPVVGVLGDSTFFHSGMTGLMDVIYNKGKSTLVVLDNRITAMTGHQDNPGTGKTINGEETFAADIAEIARAMGMKNVATVNPRNLEETSKALKKAIESDEPELVIAKEPCPLAYKQKLTKGMRVNQDNCKKCGACLKLGCPALERDENKTVTVNSSLCVACGLCKQVCRFSALEEFDLESTKGGLV
ncbi:MAG: indolepyruvate ferredoxin oxidoreductase subunit alpha [Thermoguttaceae bacterium]|nr:indolepyruvate ferredoxin oxidoreductase subunit alpha [Thermoguttaceae bacterium]